MFLNITFLGVFAKICSKILRKVSFLGFGLFSYIKDPQMYRKRQYQKSTASHGPMTLIFSERLFYLYTNQESPILEQFERKVSFWDTLINVFPAYLLNYNKYECNQDFCGKIPNKYPLFVEMQLPNPKKAHHEDPTTSHYCTQGF